MAAAKSASENKSQAENPFFNFQGGMIDAFREVYDLQMKSVHSAMDQSLRFGQSYTDFLQGQVNDSVKFGQESVRYGWNLTEEWKRTAQSVAERSFNLPH